ACGWWSVLLRTAHAANSSSESCEATISRYTSLVFISSLWLPMPTIRPSSSTIILSALSTVLTRWATIIIVELVISRRRAMRGFGGAAHLKVGGILFAVLDVVGDGAREEHGLLRHEGHFCSQVLL